MTHYEVMQKLTCVFQEFFDNDEIELSDSTTAAELEGWDSLTNIKLLMQIELEFKVTFNSTEIADIPNIGELAGLIVEKS